MTSNVNGNMDSFQVKRDAVELALEGDFGIHEWHKRWLEEHPQTIQWAAAVQRSIDAFFASGLHLDARHPSAQIRCDAQVVKEAWEEFAIVDFKTVSVDVSARTVLDEAQRLLYAAGIYCAADDVLIQTSLEEAPAKEADAEPATQFVPAYELVDDTAMSPSFRREIVRAETGVVTTRWAQGQRNGYPGECLDTVFVPRNGYPGETRAPRDTPSSQKPSNGYPRTPV